MNQRDKANHLRSLHKRGNPLVLVNAWDAASARIFEEADSKAIATTSAGLASSLGYADGQNLPWTELVACVGRIARVVKLPVTTDVEAGYADSIEDLKRNVLELIKAGAVGLNLEDSLPGSNPKKLLAQDQQVAKVRAVRAAGDAAGVPIVINARTDAYWADPEPDEEKRIAETVARGRAYLQAGADCIFIPGAMDLNVISRLVKEIDGCVNILAVRGTPSISELAKAGVARVSVGSGAARATLALAREIAQELLGRGTYSSFTDKTVPYPEVNALFR
jgi:2-methylisocitrate lyase-like PEP mutase family enzyme